jgi:membrane-associated phospholipid phosphatase
MTSRGRSWLWVGLWLAAMAVGFWLDRPVAEYARRAAIDRDHPLSHLLKMGGDARFTLAVALALLVWHSQSWRAAGLLALCATTGAFVYSIGKWVAGRHRPVVGIDPLSFRPFRNGLDGLFDEPNLSFPSGHVCLAFATAACLAICIPRWRYAFYSLAAVVAVERVAENAHYVTDVIAGAAAGILSTYLTFRACEAIERSLGRRATKAAATPPGPDGDLPRGLPHAAPVLLAERADG